MINRDMIVNGQTMIDTPQCTGMIVIAAIVALAALRYVFEGAGR